MYKQYSVSFSNEQRCQWNITLTQLWVHTIRDTFFYISDFLFSLGRKKMGSEH